jgi:signal transduction histidine kinase
VDIRTKELEHSLEEKYQLIKKVEGQEALMKERLRISRELHDDIGSTLGSISIYSEVAKNRTAKNQNTNEVLSKIGHASRELIDKMSDIVWSLNSNNESFKQIQNRMIAFSALIFVQRNVLYDFFADEKLNELQFSSEQCRNIFLIFKEAIYNIVKYADCKNVHIRFTQEDGYLSMLIQDDGKGFDVHQVKTNRTSSATEYLGGNGINNMEVRAEEINAKLSIHSTINQGTTVRLTLYV